ncbi:MAG: AAA family ATPase [Thermodesulfobacteriota bacterium]
MPFAIIKRALLEELRRDIRRKEIAFLIGPRQAGKTTIMQIIQGELEAAGEKTLFLSLDYDREYFASQQSPTAKPLKVWEKWGHYPGWLFLC